MQDDTKTREQFQEVMDYRALVLRYEAIDAEIDQLIMTHGGHSEDMPDADRERYRMLARQRDDLQNEMRAMEQRLLDEE
ncbi:MAG: hypothetical protein KC547_14740 [Anaerolineae bacterium]|nr:hypothetical protein [Anaerolineae bacterium]